MNIKDFMYQYILPHLGRITINALTSTVRLRWVNYDQVHALRSKGEKIVYIFWHGRQFLLVRSMSKKNIGIMSSTSRDGILQSEILKKFGYEIIFGSSDKSPVRALVGSIQKMREGFDIAFAVDGPRGPVHIVKPGALYLAKKMKTVIVPAATAAHPSIVLRSWDRYMIPKPFAHAAIVFGDPYTPSHDMDENTIQKECEILRNTLNTITKEADDIIRDSSSQ